MEESVARWLKDALQAQSAVHTGFVDYHRHRVRHEPSQGPPLPPDILGDASARASVYMCRVARIVRENFKTPQSVPCTCRNAWDMLCVIMHQYQALHHNFRSLDYNRFFEIMPPASEHMDEHWPSTSPCDVAAVDGDFSREIGMLDKNSGNPVMDVCARLHDAACGWHSEATLPEINEYDKMTYMDFAFKHADKRMFWDDVGKRWRDESWDMDRRVELMFDVYHAVNSVRLDLLMIMDGLLDG